MQVPVELRDEEVAIVHLTWLLALGLPDLLILQMLAT